MAALARGDLHALAGAAHNALAAPAKRLVPQIDEAERALRARGALFAQMTGSGSAVVGAFADEKTRDAACRALKGRFPFVEKTAPCARGVTICELPD